MDADEKDAADGIPAQSRLIWSFAFSPSYVDAPAHKKRKTGPTKASAPEEVSEEEEEPEEVSEDEDAVAPPGGGEDEEDEANDDDEEEPVEGESGDDAEADTAKVSEPAKTAVKIKGAVVPKEADLVEVEGDDD